MEEKISWVDKMIARESIPKQLRDETVEVFCKENNIGENTYYYQSRKPKNQKEILELSVSIARREVPEILKVLVEKAKDGDMRAVDTYLDSVAKLSKHLDVTTKGKEINEMSYEQAQRILKRRDASFPNSSEE